MRHTLAPVILSLLAARIIYEDADSPLPPASLIASRREVDSLLEPPMDVLLDRPSESLFERLLCVFHALLGNCKPSWMKSKPVSKPAVRASRDIPAFDNEAVVALQVSSVLESITAVTCFLEILVSSCAIFSVLFPSSYATSGCHALPELCLSCLLLTYCQ